MPSTWIVSFKLYDASNCIANQQEQSKGSFSSAWLCAANVIAAEQRSQREATSAFASSCLIRLDQNHSRLSDWLFMFGLQLICVAYPTPDHHNMHIDELGLIFSPFKNGHEMSMKKLKCLLSTLITAMAITITIYLYFLVLITT